MAQWGRQTSSRIIKAQNLTWTGGGTIVSTTFLNETFQVRVISPVPGWIAIDSVGGSSTVPTTAGGGGTFIAANTANGDYFTVTGGQILSFSSTSTSTTSPFISVTEMS